MNKPRQTPPDPAPSPDLIQIEKLGSLLFSPLEVGRIVGRPDLEKYASELSNGHTPEAQSYQRGRLLSEVGIRESLLELARSGSMAHCKEALKIMQTTRAEVEDLR